VSRFGTHELLVLSIENMANESRRHCRARVKEWKVKPPISDFPPYRTTPVIVGPWAPSDSAPLQWWQNPVVSTFAATCDPV